jgi:hypothetical protein
MEIKKTIHESFDFAQTSVWGEWKRWIILTIMSIVFPFIIGYTMEIYRGRAVPFNPENYVKLFIDGCKLIIAGIIYFIPVGIIILVSFYPLIMRMITGILSGEEFTLEPLELAPFILQIIGGTLLAFIVGIILFFISTIGLIRMAKMEKFSEAFNFAAILETVRGIGWGAYIVAMIILCLILAVVSVIFSLIDYIPILGMIITFFLGVPLTLFEARYLTMMYESSET